MKPPGLDLRARVLAWQALFVVGTAVLVSPLVPRLLLLSGPVRDAATRSLLAAIGTGGIVALLHNGLLLQRHRSLLRALASDASSVDPSGLRELDEDSWRVITGSLAPPLAGLALIGTLFRPALIDLTTGVSVGLLGTVIVAAASLPLSVVVRGVFVHTLEQAPVKTMRRVVEQLERAGEPQRGIPRRLLFAVALPVAFVSIGAALVTSAHVRRADERQRQETASIMARAALSTSSVPGSAEGAAAAVEVAERLGFSAGLNRRRTPIRVSREAGGAFELMVPVQQGSAVLRYGGSSVGVFSPMSLVLTLLSVAIAALLGALLGRALSDDLANATRRVRALGTRSPAKVETQTTEPARFGLVEELGLAIERLADRFQVFARAQERAIGARERAARMRGLFFASVSHDLKSPLNAILGFTGLVRQNQELEAGQEESLELIERRGRELHALIETILDAARVDAGQLELMREPITVSDLFGEALAKGRDLGGDQQAEVVAQIVEGVPELSVDRLRLTRALATIIGHAIRSSEKSYVRMRAAPSRAGGARIDVEVPSTRLSARQLASMLDPSPDPGAREHRGLALGLSLARAVIEQHGGSVNITDRGAKGSVFTIRVPIGPPPGV